MKSPAIPPPLPNQFGHEARHDLTSGPTPQSDQQPYIRNWNLNEKSILDPDWIWYGWLPRGKVTVLGTPSGSDFSGVLADIVARVSLGIAFPCRTQPADSVNSQPGPRVAVVTSGGDPRRDFGRLVTHAGGRLDRVQFSSGVIEPAGPDGDPVERSLALPADFPVLRQWALNGAGPVAPPGSLPSSPNDPIALLVIEALPQQVAKWREPEMRTLMDQLNRLASERHMAILLVTPLKVPTTKVSAKHLTLAKVYGSSMLVESAAALWHIEKNASDPGRYDLISHKVCRKPPTIGFSVGENGISWMIPGWDDPRPINLWPGQPDRAFVMPVMTPRVSCADENPSPSRARQEAVNDYRIPKGAAPTQPLVFDRAQAHPRHEPASWPEAAVNQEQTSHEPDPRPHRSLVDPPPPPRKTEAELRQSPEWKRASRQERKRLLQTARASPVAEAVPSRDTGIR